MAEVGEIKPEEQRFEVEDWEIGGSKVKFVGVTHEPGTFRRFQKEFTQIVQTSDLVILEGAPAAGNIFSPESLNSFARVSGLPPGPSTRAKVEAHLKSEPGFAFDIELEKLAKVYNKKIATLDPWFLEEGNWSQLAEGRQMETAVEAITILTALGGVGGGGLALKSIDLNDLLRLKPDRRDFLKMGGAGLGILAGLPGLSRFLERAGTQSRAENIAGFALYSIRDYRDVAISYILNELVRLNIIPQKTSMIYGSVHKDSVNYYNQNPEERNRKFKLYAPFKAYLPPQFNEFTPSRSTSNGWNLTRKIAL